MDKVEAFSRKESGVAEIGIVGHLDRLNSKGDVESLLDARE